MAKPSLIATLFDIVASIFGWLRNTSDPQVKAQIRYDKALADWQKEMTRLERIRDEACDVHDKYVFGTRLVPGEYQRLRDAYQAAEKAVGSHRRKQPINSVR